jgi:hypothetical protein
MHEFVVRAAHPHATRLTQLLIDATPARNHEQNAHSKVRERERLMHAHGQVYDGVLDRRRDLSAMKAIYSHASIFM